MMTRLTLIAAAATAALAFGAAQAQAHGGSSSSFAYAGQDDGYPDDEGDDCGRDRFTILGADAGATVLGFNAGVGGHFGFGDGCHPHRRHQSIPAPQAYAPEVQGPPPADPYPPAYPQAPWGAPYAYRSYGAPGYTPPPPPPPAVYGDPCEVCAEPSGW